MSPGNCEKKTAQREILRCNFTENRHEINAPEFYDVYASVYIYFSIWALSFQIREKIPTGCEKKYPCIEIIYDFFCHKYSKLHVENVGIDLKLVL